MLLLMRIFNVLLHHLRDTGTLHIFKRMNSRVEVPVMPYIQQNAYLYSYVSAVLAVLLARRGSQKSQL